MTEKKMCEGCHCDGKNEATKPHTCPFAEEIVNDYSLCTCCEECEYQCAQDI